MCEKMELRTSFKTGKVKKFMKVILRSMILWLLLGSHDYQGPEGQKFKFLKRWVDDCFHVQKYNICYVTRTKFCTMKTQALRSFKITKITLPAIFKSRWRENIRHNRLNHWFLNSMNFFQLSYIRQILNLCSSVLFFWCFFTKTGKKEPG